MNTVSIVDVLIVCAVFFCSLRLQAYLSLKMFSLKKSEAQNLRRAIDENFQVRTVSQFSDLLKISL
jgi:hypothetical protein